MCGVCIGVSKIMDGYIGGIRQQRNVEFQVSELVKKVPWPTAVCESLERRAQPVHGD